MEITYSEAQTKWTKINDYNMKTNRCKKVKKVKQYRELTRDLLQPLEGLF